MIPILYEKTETAFVSNGLGRLRDIISCTVVEGRNSVYECDFEYPTNGANYDLIQVGRIIGVTHDDSGDVQPFDIVSFTKPIDGIVTFHCTHISYRLSYMSIRSGYAKNSLADAFTHIATYATPSCPFTFWTDKTSTGYCASLESVPHSVREVLGGIEGSILDTYGGEYEWDKWTVKLWAARGQYRDFTIRYGVNMLDYNEDYDTSGCYSSCRPYWTDGTTTVVGDMQSVDGLPPSGRVQCVPLDVSDKFESQPTKAQVENMGLSVMNAQNPTVPSQSIEVSFVRLQDMGEYNAIGNLMQCRLCDTINVIFPDFNSSGQFKIVQTEWNVLTSRYESMELGTLSVSLSEALGISNTLERSISLDTRSPVVIKQFAVPSTAWASGNNWVYSKDWHPTAVTGYTPIAVLQGTPESGGGALVLQIALNYETYGDRFVGLVRNIGSSSVTQGFNIPILYIRNDLMGS
jgi:phage-related protein